MDNPIVVQMLTVALGIVVSFAVTALRKVPFVTNHAKVVAAILAAAVSVILSVTGVVPTGILGVLVTSVTALGVSIGNYEIITKPIQEAAAETTPEPPQ